MALSQRLSGVGSRSLKQPVARWLLIGGLALAGCRSQSGEESTPAEVSKEAESKTHTDGTGEKKPIQAKKKGGSQIGEIPKDVWPEIWFDNPSAVAAEKGRTTTVGDVAKSEVKPSGGGEGRSVGAAADQATGPKTGGGGAAGDWTSLISGEVLADESKAIKSSLEAKTQTASVYNGAYKDIQVDATTLAALAQIAAEHAEAPSWKKNARFVRDVSMEMSSASTSLGEKFFRPTKTAYEKLETLLSGSQPPDLGESVEKMAFSSFAPRLALMYRLKRAYDWLKSSVNTAPLLKSEVENVIREASVIAVLSRVIIVGGYDDADDERYQELVGGVQKGALEAVSAARDQDFDAYTKAIDAIYKSCTQCHSEFKNN